MIWVVGQSGSPVLRQGQNTSIGVHVYAHSQFNLASTIGGQYGNPFQDYVQVFQKMFPAVKTLNGIRYVRVPHTKSATIKSYKTEMNGDEYENVVEADHESGPEQFNDTEAVGNESFFKVIKHLVNIGGHLLLEDAWDMNASPFQGQLADPMSAIAGGILRMSARATESAGEDSGVAPEDYNGETELDDSQEQDATNEAATDANNGGFQRAAIAEAASQTVLNMDSGFVQSSGILNAMESSYTEMSPGVRKSGPS